MHDQSQGGCSDEGDLRPWLWVTLVKQTCVYSPNFTSLDFEASEASHANRSVSVPQFESFLVVCCLADWLLTWLELNFAQVCLTQIFVTLY